MPMGVVSYAWPHSYDLKWSGTNLIVYGLWATTLSYISCVLKQSGTYAKVHGLGATALLHIPCVLRWLGIVIIQLIIFIYALRAERDKNLPWGGDLVSDNFKTTITTTFASLFSHLLTCTNPAIMMDAKQWAEVLPYFCLPSLGFLITMCHTTTSS